MDADPAIMEAGKNAHQQTGDDGGSNASKTAEKQHQKSNSTLINKVKSRSLKMRGLKTKAFFRTDRPFAASKIPSVTSESSKRAADSTTETLQPQKTFESEDVDVSKSDSSSTTIDEDIDCLSPSPSTEVTQSFRKSWSSKTKAMFSTGNVKFNAAVAAVKKARLNSGSTSSFDAVSKLDSTSSSTFSVMDMTTNNSSGCGEIMNFDMSMSSNGSDASGESLDSEFGRVLQLSGTQTSADVTVGSPRYDPAAKTVIAALNAPKPEPHRGNQRTLSADDVFEEPGGGLANVERGLGSSAKIANFEVGVAPGLRKFGVSGTNSLGAAEMLYAKEIFGHFLKIQAEFQASIPFPATLGTLARGDTRAILISWIVQVHDYEDLENESLYLTVRITDTYCSVHDVVLAEIQLVGIAAIFIASKQEERFPPEGKDLVRYTNNAYTIQDLYKMELQILGKLKFKVSMPICWTFATYLLTLQNQERPREVDWMTFYLLELSLLSKPLIVIVPSLVASAAVYMARFLFLDDESEDPWPASISGPSSHSISNLRPVVCELLALLQSTPVSKFNASFVKYSSESKYRGLSKLPILHNSFSLKRLSTACCYVSGAGLALNTDPPT